MLTFNFKHGLGGGPKDMLMNKTTAKADEH